MLTHEKTEVVNVADPQAMGRLVQKMAQRIADLEHSVQMMGVLLGLSIGLADNPAYPANHQSGTLSAALDKADLEGQSCLSVDSLRAGLKVGSEPPEPNGRAFGNIVRLFERVNAKAA